jgi:hypothetical protein
MKPVDSDHNANKGEKPKAGQQLTDEQMAFAKLLGQVLARKWQLEQQNSTQQKEAQRAPD